MVGAAGFEPAAPCSQRGKRRLPNLALSFIILHDYSRLCGYIFVRTARECFDPRPFSRQIRFADGPQNAEEDSMNARVRSPQRLTEALVVGSEYDGRPYVVRDEAVRGFMVAINKGSKPTRFSVTSGSAR